MTFLLRSVDPDNGGTSFGFAFRDKLLRLAVVLPTLKYDPSGLPEQVLDGDFTVRKA